MAASGCTRGSCNTSSIFRQVGIRRSWRLLAQPLERCVAGWSSSYGIAAPARQGRRLSVRSMINGCRLLGAGLSRGIPARSDCPSRLHHTAAHIRPVVMRIGLDRHLSLVGCHRGASGKRQYGQKRGEPSRQVHCAEIGSIRFGSLFFTSPYLFRAMPENIPNKGERVDCLQRGTSTVFS